MNFLRNSRSVFSRLMILRRYYNPTQPSPAPPPGSRSDVLDTIRGLFFHPAKPAASCRTPAPSLPAAFSRSQPSIHRARRWYRDPWTVAGASGATVLLPYATVFTLCAAVSHKETVPYTNRTHRVVLSPKFERELGDELLEKIKKKRNKDILGPSDPKAVRVRLIASDIIRGIQDVFPTNSRGDDDAKLRKAAVQPQTGHLDDLQWEVIVIRDESDSACSLGGGKIVVFTGLLNSLETDAEIAAVIAHEVGFPYYVVYLSLVILK
jgi:metalloendopeptidase OMA1, mitochondrial